MSGQALLVVRRAKLTEDGHHLLYVNGVLQHEVLTSAYIEDGDEVVILTSKGEDNQLLIEHPDKHKDPEDNHYFFRDKER